MPQLIAALLVIVVALWIAWLAVALFVRVLAWVLVFWTLTFMLGLALGVLTGVVLPPLALLGRTGRKPAVATPDGVREGTVLGKAPKGRAKYFGWDHAWPVYLPHQAKRDANAVLADGLVFGVGIFGWLFDGRVRVVVLLSLAVGFALGTGLSVLGWYLAMGLIGGIGYLVQVLGVLGYRSFDRLIRWRRKAVLYCPKCYRITDVPSYRCSGSGCSTVHHDIRPGPLGFTHRRCGCGTRLPVTVSGAAGRLVTVCPFCLQDVPEGSGTRRVLLLPVIGAVSAGKTQFLVSAVAELRDRAETLSGSLDPISPVAEEFLRNAVATAFSGRGVGKTAWEDLPEGAPLNLSLRGRETEVQIMDAAGENFVGWKRSQALGYIDTADILLFVLDPLALPQVHERLRLAGEQDTVPLAQGDQEDAYAGVVDRLRAEDVRLGSKRLAVVLTKFDVLRTLPDEGAPDPADSDSIEGWLRANGAHGLVRRIKRDFRRVEYFAVDSRGTRESSDPFHPVRVLDWALRTVGPRSAVLARAETVPDGKGEGR